MYAACLTLAQAVNPLLFGTHNVLAPRAAQAFVAGGMQEVRRVILVVMLFLGLTLLGWCVLLAVCGESLITALYGARYPETMWIAGMLAAVVLVRSLGVVSLLGLQTIERPEFGLWANLASLAVLLVVAPMLIPHWGVFGVASSIFTANAVGFLIRLGAFFHLSRGPEPTGALS